MSHSEQAGYVLRVAGKHPEFFNGRRVLEIGSRDVNGSVRRYFRGCDYVGLDCTPGRGVDVVCLAHEYDPPAPFDVVISCEAFEHDPHLAETVGRAIELLRPGGLFLATWASPLRAEHGTERSTPGEVYGPDGGYYRGVAADEFVRILAGRLDPLEVLTERDGLDVYAYGFKRI
jgi:SAM-dependent methyltransferase